MRESPLTYQPNARALACTPARSFAQSIADACRQIRRSATPRIVKDSRDDRLVTDFQRGRGLVQIERLANVSRTCSDPADATALADCFREHALSGHHALITATEALRTEAEADGAEDQAVFEYLSNKCPATRHRAIEAL